MITHPFAVLKMGSNLALVKFTDEDAWREALRVYAGQKLECKAFRWHYGAEVWQEVEIVT